ncbi:hypothetical protein D3C86_2184220 [compost metagenome]
MPLTISVPPLVVPIYTLYPLAIVIGVQDKERFGDTVVDPAAGEVIVVQSGATSLGGV